MPIITIPDEGADEDKSLDVLLGVDPRFGDDADRVVEADPVRWWLVEGLGEEEGDDAEDGKMVLLTISNGDGELDDEDDSNPNANDETARGPRLLPNGIVPAAGSCGWGG